MVICLGDYVYVSLYISNFHHPRTFLQFMAVPTWVATITSTGNAYVCSHLLFACCFPPQKKHNTTHHVEALHFKF